MVECPHKIPIPEVGPNLHRSGPNPQSHRQLRILGPGLRRFPHLKGGVGPIPDPRAQVRVRDSGPSVLKTP